MSDYYLINVGNKSYYFVRTDTGRWFDINGCHILTDDEIPDRDGLIPDARAVSNDFVAERVAESTSTRAKIRRSSIRRFKREVSAV